MTTATTLTEVKVIHEGDATVVIEGDECALIYAHTDRMLFCVSTLLPGQRSSLDPGHAGADEIGYIIQGTIVVQFPQLQRSVRLEAGDVLLIPEGEPHALYNVGSEVAKMSWSSAPQLGREATPV
jgi:mannose-6-phosphate isomerase-like protein (cupin superfamily)